MMALCLELGDTLELAPARGADGVYVLDVTCAEGAEEHTASLLLTPGDLAALREAIEAVASGDGWEL